eukprot:6374365-Alexandrium_andersonii.AAC.1
MMGGTPRSTHPGLVHYWCNWGGLIWAAKACTLVLKRRRDRGPVFEWACRQDESVNGGLKALCQGAHCGV